MLLGTLKLEGGLGIGTHHGIAKSSSSYDRDLGHLITTKNGLLRLLDIIIRRLRRLYRLDILKVYLFEHAGGLCCH